jgi:flagellar biosynthetic protein FlhB
MAEESDLERTEPASARRLEQAREEGQVARSQELSTFAVVLAGAAGLWLVGDRLAHSMRGLVRDALDFERAAAFDEARGIGILGAQAFQALLAFLPFGGVVLAAALLAPLLLHGWLFSPGAAAPDIDRLDPLAGLQRMFSWNSLAELVKSLLKAGLLTATAVWVGWKLGWEVVSLGGMPLESALEHTTRLAGISFLALLAALAVVVAIDVPYQIWSFRRKLRMTREELRQEMKETEGDPQLKARVRSVQREAARRRMMAAVPKADVVVTNPLRYAVALRYREGGRGAPTVVAKGAFLIAARIRELAGEHGVPVVEAPPLARALYRHVAVDREIPQALYAAVAEVLAYVFQLRQAVARGGPRPQAPGRIEVPAGLDPEGAGA